MTMKKLFTLLLLFGYVAAYSGSGDISGQLKDNVGEAIAFANVALYNSITNELVKVEISDLEGAFTLKGIPEGTYHLQVTFVGYSDIDIQNIVVEEGQEVDLKVLAFEQEAIELAEATVTAQRAMLEVKPDRTVFNVQGTINSTGSDALELLRKAPGVTVDNNDNVNVLGRSGVLYYVDGKRLPLSGQDLTNFLQSLPAEQIDRIDIITNPGAKYEAEGNAGIIDIKLKKDDSIGFNGTASSTVSQGQYARFNVNTNGNYRNKVSNTFFQLGYSDATSLFNITSLGTQNGLLLDEVNENISERSNYNFRIGTDFFMSKKSTLGFLVGGRYGNGDSEGFNRIVIAPSNASRIDSILVAQSFSESQRDQNTYNVNYRFDNSKGRTLNIDLDYGRFDNENQRLQPNQYFDQREEEVLTEVVNSFDTPSEIDIYTFNLDFEDKLLGGTFGFGSRITRVNSDNTFLFFNNIGSTAVLNDASSNLFDYTENVFAGYISYVRNLGEKLSLSAGLRAEQTDAMGNLQAFLPELQEPPVDLNYLNWFPNAGLTWQVDRVNTLSLNYGRRINRPDYNVLNPFNNQLSELSYQRGNPFLRPEIVNNIELGYTFKYRYNFKLAYSKTSDQITRLISPDDRDPRASFITWANLSNQTIYSLNISAPVGITNWWNAYVNLNASHIDNQADYGDGAVVDVQALSYNLFQQHTFSLPGGWKAELSSFYNGPGVWGGVFEYNARINFNVGIQKKFLNEKLNARLSVNDIFLQQGFDGTSNFNGLDAYMEGMWDSRRVSLSLSYNFGNDKVKGRKRQTGLDDAAKRVGEGG
jgi:outer membrane receptor protein involved in Fe transport